jgi:CO/xanthine dehydrogenase Mo-binding subunit
VTAERNIYRTIGSGGPRVDAAEKVTGRAIYSTDIDRPGMLHAKILRSNVAHAKLVKIDASKARAAPGVHAVLTRDELDQVNSPVYGYFIKDQPIVAMDRVRYEGDTLAAVAAETEAQAEAALALINVELEELPSVPDLDAALDGSLPELFEEAPMGIVPKYGAGASGALRPIHNACYLFSYTTGSAAAFDGCDHVFEDTFEFSRMHHLHLEPFVTVAETSGEQIEIWTSGQNPFPLRKELSRVFGMPENRITVHTPYIGGGFGAKNNCKTEPVAILLSKMAGRPVRLSLTVEENFLTNTQHAARLIVKTGVMNDGRFVARESTIYLDSGAYSDASPLVAEKAGYRIPGPYRWDYIQTDCYCMMTNTSPAGPFRGFGGTQTTWASESQIDMIARRLDMDPIDIRKKNLLKLGDPFVPGESGMDSDLAYGLDLVAKEIGYGDKDRPANRGVGLSIGFKDGGGVNKPALARVKVATGGDALLQCGTAEIGQGAKTAMSRVVAEILKLDPARVTFAPINTDHTPFDQGTNASSAITVMGQAVERAAHKVRDEILEFAATQLGIAAEKLDLADGMIVNGEEKHPLNLMVMGYYGGTGFEFSADGYFKSPNDHEAPLESPCVFWEIGWGAVEVEVDPDTGRLTVHKLVVSGDAGAAIHPLVCRGQDEGAAVMGLGQALFETMQYDGTVLTNGTALGYRVPLASDIPASFVSITQEQGHGPGPFGSKGMGEGGMLPVASAIANAVEDAVGVRITSLPITPQKILKALREKA